MRGVRRENCGWGWRRAWGGWLVLVLMCGGLLPAARAQDADAPAKSRTFRFGYGATLTQLPVGARLRVWMPVPRSSEYQQVELLDDQLPATARVDTEPRYGNSVLYFEMPAPESGSVELRRTYRVRRCEVRGLQAGPSAVRRLTEEERTLFLTPNALGPIDGKPLRLLDGLRLPEEPLALGRALYDRVDEHMKYDKSIPGYGKGDVAWACDSRTGNCTDFHSLFISLARSRNLPARFEIGFPLPTERGQGAIGGYHCWGLFHVQGRGWVPVDISEADKNPELRDYYFGNLTENRVTFSIGRDLTLVPPQAGPPLNYLVYPYVELNDRPLPAERVQMRFTYEDL